MSEEKHFYEQEEIMRQMGDLERYFDSRDLAQGLRVNACLNYTLNKLRQCGIAQHRLMALCKSFDNAYASIGGESKWKK